MTGPADLSQHRSPTNAERQAALRNARRAAGLHQVTIWLSTAALARLDEAAALAGTSRDQAADAILTEKGPPAI